MTLATANKGGARYLYYISAPLLQGRKEDAGSTCRVSAPDLEAVLTSALRQRSDETKAAECSEETPGPIDRNLIEQHLEKVTVGKGAIEIRHAEEEMDA